MKIDRLIAIVFLMYVTACDSGKTASPAAAVAEPALTGCQPHIEAFSAAHWAKELERSEEWVLQNHRLNLWEHAGTSRGAKVGELLPGSRAVIIEETADAFRVQSPLDKSRGWISRIQVARTLEQDVATRQPCKRARSTS
jgi:hypothetical protein